MASRTDSTSENVALDDDDKHPLELDKEFNGATLEISGHEQDVRGANNDNDGPSNSPPQTQVPTGGLSRDRPGSTIGRTSIRSTTSSRTSMRPGMFKNDSQVNDYYSYKESNFDKAVSSCKHIIKPELDGDYQGAWLLTEIDHWNLEREKILFLTKYSIFIVKFNFINNKMFGFRRIMLHIIKEISVGDFEYPSISIMPGRQHGGIQIRWGSPEDLSFGQRWNPWSSTIPWITLCHHPIIYNPKENETSIYNVDDFYESVVGAVSKVFVERKPGENLKVIEGPIQIDSYASPHSAVFNQSSLGFFRDRNGACF